MRLNKTEQALLSSARNGIIGIDYAYGCGPEGGKVSQGARKANAALSLVKKGLIERTDFRKTARPDRGYTVWCVDVTFKVL